VDVQEKTAPAKCIRRRLIERCSLAFEKFEGGAGTSRLMCGLEQALGELALATKTVQRLMVEKGLLCTPEECGRMVQEIDLEDGVADGRSLPR
jgi:hypothetical protein